MKGPYYWRARQRRKQNAVFAKLAGVALEMPLWYQMRYPIVDKDKEDEARATMQRSGLVPEQEIIAIESPAQPAETFQAFTKRTIDRIKDHLGLV